MLEPIIVAAIIIVNTYVVIAALIGAIVWNIVTWIFGIPSSSSHALIGGLIGAGIFSSGFNSIVFSGLIKVLLFIFIATLLGFIGACVFAILLMWIFRKSAPDRINRYFRKL